MKLLARGVYQLHRLHQRLRRLVGPRPLLLWALSRCIALGSRHLSKRLLLACEVAMELMLSLTYAHQVQWLQRHRPSHQLLGEVHDQSQKVGDALRRKGMHGLCGPFPTCARDCDISCVNDSSQDDCHTVKTNMLTTKDAGMTKTQTILQITVIVVFRHQVCMHGHVFVTSQTHVQDCTCLGRRGLSP